MIDQLAYECLCMATDGTNLFVGTDDGKIQRIVAADGTIADTAFGRLVGEKATCMAINSTHLIVGTDRGTVYKYTIIGGARVTIMSLNQTIVGISINSGGTLICLLTKGGLIYRISLD